MNIFSLRKRSGAGAAAGGVAALMTGGCGNTEKPPDNAVEIHIHDRTGTKGVDIQVPSRQNETHIEVKR